MFNFPDNPHTGDLVTGSNGATYRWSGTAWVAAGPPPTTVQSFNGRTGPVILTQGDVNLGLGYTPYNAVNPSHFISDAANDGNAYLRLSASWINGDTRYMLQSVADARYVQLSGAEPMTGLLTLSGSPTAANHAANKAYADARPYVATTTGQVSVTGTTTETNLAVLRIPGGTMGANGIIELKTLWQFTNNSNNKTLIARFTSTSGSTAGGNMGSPVVVTTTAASQQFHAIRNNNAANAQVMWAATGTTPFGTAASTPLTLTVDTTADSFINLNGQLAAGTDTVTLLHAYAVVFPHA